MAFAGVRPVIPDREMLCAAIVPDRDIVLTPAVANLIIGVPRVLEEELQNGAAFLRIEFADACSEHRIHEDNAATGFRMRGDHGVFGARIDFSRLGHAGVAATIIMLRIKLRLIEPETPGWRGEPVPGGIPAGTERVSTRGRHEPPCRSISSHRPTGKG